MEKRKEYPRVEFSATALQKIIAEFKDIVKDPTKASFNRLKIDKKEEGWR